MIISALAEIIENPPRFYRRHRNPKKATATMVGKTKPAAEPRTGFKFLKRGFSTWQQSLLLVMLGAGVGYPSFVNISIWGGAVSRYQGVYILGFFAGALAFISGFVSFLAIAVKVFTSSPESPTVEAPSSPSAVATSVAERSLPLPRPIVKRQAAPVQVPTAHVCLRIALIAVIALAGIRVMHWGGPPLASSYGRHYWLIAVLTLMLSQLPSAVALVRSRNALDRPGLALAMAVGVAQVLVAFSRDLQYHAAPPDPWPWLSASLGLSVVGLAYLGWRSSPSRKSDAGLLISIFFGFVAYTALAQIALAALNAWVRG